MADAILRYEIFDPIEPNAAPRGDVLGMPYASGAISTKMAEFSTGDAATRTMTVPSVAADPFTIPPSPTGAKRVLVRLWADRDRILLTMARNPTIAGGSIDPPIPRYGTASGPDPVPYISLEQSGPPLLLSLEPGAKIRPRAAYMP